MNTSPVEIPSSLHPRAGQVLSGAEIMIQVIADEGVETIFGYSGGAILPTYDAVFRYNQEQAAAAGRPIPLIVPANEQGAGFMGTSHSCPLVAATQNSAPTIRGSGSSSIPNSARTAAAMLRASSSSSRPVALP